MADPVWLMVMFDLPVKTKEQRRGANRYRNMLYDQGFSQVQFSVYAKYLINASGVRSLLPRLRQAIPVNGEVRVLRLTDEQWSSTYRYFGDREVSPEERPSHRKPSLVGRKDDSSQLSSANVALLDKSSWEEGRQFPTWHPLNATTGKSSWEEGRQFPTDRTSCDRFAQV